MAQFYHIYNRGVEKRTIFLDDEDYLRFINDLYEFNDADQVYPAPILKCSVVRIKYSVFTTQSQE